MRRVLLDINVVLDVLLNRPPFAADAHLIWRASDEGAFDACIAAFSIPTIHYLCERHAGRAAARQAIEHCVHSFDITPFFPEAISKALDGPSPDFEDNLQIACAEMDYVQAIITRNTRDYAGSPIQLYTPAEFLRTLD